MERHRRWRDEAAKAGCVVARLAVAFEAGRDGIWLVRWSRPALAHVPAQQRAAVMLRPV